MRELAPTQCSSTVSRSVNRNPLGTSLDAVFIEVLSACAQGYGFRKWVACQCKSLQSRAFCSSAEDFVNFLFVDQQKSVVVASEKFQSVSQRFCLFTACYRMVSGVTWGRSQFITCCSRTYSFSHHLARFLFRREKEGETARRANTKTSEKLACMPLCT